MIKRNTIQCNLVLDAVNELRHHPTANELYDSLSTEHPNISRATVYRNLQRLCDTGKIRKVQIPGESDRFDYRCDSHYHAKCLKCGHVFDVEMDYINDMEKHIKDTHGFVFTGHDIVFNGICAKCTTNDRA